MEKVTPAVEKDATSELESHLIPHLPSSFYYVPNFITAEEESALRSQISSKPYIELSKRRLQVYPAQLTAKNVLLSKDPLPSWLVDMLQPKFAALGVFGGAATDGKKAEFNHCLINSYQPGEGIMPHEDGPAYYPVTATVSLASHTVLEIAEKRPDGGAAQKWWILQEPRSLLVTRDEAYGDTIHGIAEVAVDANLGLESIANWELLGDTALYKTGSKERGERTSLTCRSVVKVSKLGSKLFAGR